MNQKTDNLTSWTSSLLWKIQLAIYRRRKDFDKPQADQIHIVMVNARALASHVFLPAVPLMQYYGLADKFNKLMCEYYESEYLSQGQLDLADLRNSGFVSSTSLHDLIQHGLYDIYTSLPDNKDLLARAVLRWRSQHFPPLTDQVATTADVDTACRMATQCFPGRLSGVALLAILSLTLRLPDDREIMKVFRSHNSSKLMREMKKFCLALLLPDLFLMNEDIPPSDTISVRNVEECVQLYKLMDEIRSKGLARGRFPLTRMVHSDQSADNLDGAMRNLNSELLSLASTGLISLIVGHSHQPSSIKRARLECVVTPLWKTAPHLVWQEPPAHRGAERRRRRRRGSPVLAPVPSAPP